MDRPDLKTASRLGKKPGIVIEETTGYLHYTFPMRTDTAPFDDNNVRMALKHAVNREEIVEKILYGHGTVGNDHPIAPSVAYHAADLEQRHYDPDKAKFYAKKAGGISVKLSAADAAFAGAVDAATLYKEHAAAAGIEIEVVREPNDGYWSNVWMKKAWGACYWGGRPTQDWMFSTAYQGGGSWNDTFWAHTRFDELLISARAETDSEKRRAMYFEMQQIVRDEGGVVVPMFANNVWAASDKIAHGSLAQNWTMDGNKFMEKWWFA
jgi:peptide/nickel transport system substrate-binding protein